jgi:hemoglobin
MDLLDTQVYSLIGEDGFHRLVAAFYKRVPTDDILSTMYPPEDLEGAQERLREFLVMRFGGPQRYLQARGHPRLRMRHAPFAITQAARNRWIERMDEALAEVALPEKAVAMLRKFFNEAATFMINR